MAISDLSLFSSMTYALDQTTSNIQTIEQQLSTGKQVVEPSDNLVNYGQAQLLSARSSAVSNDINTATQIQGSLTTADNALSSVSNWLDSAISIATQGADGGVSTSQMATLGGQVQSILQQVIGAANTQYTGAYLFGGSQNGNAPYDPSGNYLGDATNTYASFSDGTKIQSTFNGQAIFGNSTTGAIGALTSLQNALQSGNKTVTASALTQLQSALTSVATADGNVGVNENSVQTFLTNANTESISLQTSISNLTDADVAQDSLNEQEALLQEQALVSMASGLGKIPQVNIIA
jgi:flagellar hook-associated protein 3 FlgL